MPLALAAPRVLVYTRTLGFRHDSIPTAIETLRARGPGAGVAFEFTEDATLFADATLARFDALMFVSTSEEVLDGAQQRALERYLRAGGVYAGVHSASACLYNNSVYLKAVGAYFDYHPDLQPATFVRLDNTHPATAHLPDRWTFTEEVYYYRQDPRAVGARVLLTVDAGSYVNNAGSRGNYTFGTPHPIAWYIETPEYGDMGARAGRSFYTSLGHTNETWQDETFIAHVLGGLTWALEGATTRAYGSGLVGNNETSVRASSSPNGSGAGSAAVASGTSGGSAATPSAPAPSQSSSGARTMAAAGAAVGAAAAGLLTSL
ncbi:class I glutamine amidotransferase-like protein [Cutaneotrichosporon oleaginosum]|uniref:Class I glutamine amidotransferase-like protein n=1 Tax=Cutaneotrichosporon oleaginosum TaxID=879819 RepID=A0A0J0XCM2_9TREE|nr:class I glutamine amidotransferase-like protein [Cutaneotrichosporon oleaginosum]KLT38807.1 class I glutamine amidotransferase-like protein [Cutaneotrichosporon oleaginosum]TXT06211.1 hypothetical protein COLE_05542 [Cutaneotrichosporon oleaginosum]